MCAAEHVGWGTEGVRGGTVVGCELSWAGGGAVVTRGGERRAVRLLTHERRSANEVHKVSTVLPLSGA